jgi:hypothetical protein
MHALHIALQEGFAHDDIVVSVDDGTVYRAEGVSTRPQIGLAASIDTQVGTGVHAVEVQVPNRKGLSHLQTLSIDSDLWLGISIRGGELSFKSSPTPFGYL